MNSELFERINDIPNPDENTSYYCILDTSEGSDCFGHWIHECALFLPFVKELRAEYPTMKILLHCKRRYKLNTLIDFGFTENDIEYSSFMLESTKCHCDSWNSENDHLLHGWVLPVKKNYVAFLPKFPFVNVTVKENKILQTVAHAFKEFYDIYSEKEKTIPILYLIRSRKENYESPNKRQLVNLDEMLEMLKKHNVEILDVDTLSSLRDQIEIVQKAKVILNEFGSVTVNNCFFSSFSHCIILNRIPVGQNLIDVIEHFIEDSHSTWEYLDSLFPGYHEIKVDLPLLEKKIVSFLPNSCK